MYIDTFLHSHIRCTCEVLVDKAKYTELHCMHVCVCVGVGDGVAVLLSAYVRSV